MSLESDSRMTISRLSIYAIGLTVAAIVFIVMEGIPDSVSIFWNLLSADLPAAWLMLVILLVGNWYGEQRPGGKDRIEQLLMVLDRQRYAVAVALWISLCAGSLWVYHNHPLSMDEYTALFQAKIFAAGHLHGAFPPELLAYLVPPQFQNLFLMVNGETGAVFSAYWPGFSLLLAPFVWLGIPWACNPTIVTISFLLIGRVARDLTATPQATGWALLFALASPAFVANGITYYSMPAHLLFNLGFAWLLLAPSPLRLFLAGLTGGFSLVLHQPFPHAIFALPWIVWLAMQRGQRLRNLYFIALGYLPVILLLGLGWLLWRQDIMSQGVQPAVAMSAASGPSPSLFGQVKGLVGAFVSILHWPNVPILYARLGGLAKLWLWAAPMLLLLAWWGARGEKAPGLRLLCASAILTFFAYFFVPFDQGHGWGYRYFHSAWGALPVLAAVGVLKLSAVGPRAYRHIAVLALLSLVAMNGIQLVLIGKFMQAYLAQFPPRVEGERRIILHNGEGYYARDIIQNDPWLRGKEIVFLVKSDAEKEKIMSHFPAASVAGHNGYGTTLVESAAKQ